MNDVTFPKFLFLNNLYLKPENIFNKLQFTYNTLLMKLFGYGMSDFGG